jgi:hemolysin activation/secretion protein
MGWDLKYAALCCGVVLPGGVLSITPSYASLVPEASATNLQTKALHEDITVEDSTGLPTLASPEKITPIQFSPSHPVSQISQATSPTTLPDPDDRFLQSPPTPQPLPPDEQSPLIPTPESPAIPAPETLPTDETVQIPIQRIEVVGSTVFTDEDFAPIVQPIAGQSVTLEQLRAIADQITQLYLNEGYITSRAVLVGQVIEQGVVQIRVVEGSLEAIEVEGNRRVNTDYIRSRIRLGGRMPLNQSRLEDQLRLLRLDPLFDNVEASLRAGTGLGQSILTVRVVEAAPFFGELSVDNYSPPSVGSERMGVGVGYRSPTGLGDELFVSYYRSTTGGSNVFDFSYRVPVNPMNGTIQLRIAPSDYRITDPEFEVFDIEGNADLYELSFRQPLVRSPREEFALSTGFTYRSGETLISGIQVDESNTSVLRLGQDYVRRDPRGAWAVRSQFNIGTGLFNATEGAEPDGQFLSWLGQLQRVQILSTDHLLIAQLDLQFSLDPLLPSQQFVIGGGQSLRGYRQNVRTGDNGFRFSVEDRIAILRNEAGAPTLQVAPFADIGAVWNDGNNPNTLPNQTFLVGLGVGLLWNPLPGLDARLDFAIPLVDLDDRGENAQDDGVYFTVNYRF